MYPATTSKANKRQRFARCATQSGPEVVIILFCSAAQNGIPAAASGSRTYATAGRRPWRTTRVLHNNTYARNAVTQGARKVASCPLRNCGGPSTVIVGDYLPF